MKEISERETLSLLKAEIKKQFRTQAAYAEANGVQPQYVNNILKGRMTAPSWMLDLINVKKTKKVVYEIEEKHPATCESCQYEFETVKGNLTCPLCQAKNKVNPNYKC